MAFDSFTPRSSGLLVPRAFSQTYEAARITRHRKWLPTVAQDTKRTITPGVRTTLMSHGRNLFANSGLVGGAITDTATYSSGLMPVPLTSSKMFNDEILAAYKEWAKIADLSGKFTLDEIDELISIGIDVDGDIFEVLTEFDNGLPAVQLIRAHRVGNGSDDPNNPNRIVNDGVIENASGRPIAYRVLNSDGKLEREIPIQSLVYYGEFTFPDQARCISAIARGINGIFDSREVMSFVQDGIKNRTARAFFKKTTTGEIDPADYLDSDGNPISGDDGVDYEDITGGMIPRLAPGEEIVELQNQFPGDAVMPNLEFNYREFAVGYGVPLEFIWKSDLGGPAQRFFLKKASRRFARRRRTIAKGKTRRYGYFVAKQIKRGVFKNAPADWYKHDWQNTQSDISIDVGRDAQANREDLAAGNRTLQEDLGEMGRDWRDHRAQKQLEAEDKVERALDLVKKFGSNGLTFEVALLMLGRETPNGNLPQSAAAA